MARSMSGILLTFALWTPHCAAQHDTAEPEFRPTETTYRPFAEGKPQIPRAEEIVEMAGHAYNAPLNFPDIYEFEVPREFHKKLLAAFANASIDKDLPGVNDVEIGTLRIDHKGGLPIRICIFYRQLGVLHFSLHGVRCISRTSSSQDVDNMIRQAFEDETGLNTSGPWGKRKRKLVR